MNNTLQPRLRQRGRASVDFLAHVFHGTAKSHQKVQQGLEARFGDGDSLPDDLDQRHNAITRVLSTAPAYRVQQTVGE